MRKFKWSNEEEVFEVDDSTDGGKDTCKDLLSLHYYLMSNLPNIFHEHYY